MNSKSEETKDINSNIQAAKDHSIYSSFPSAGLFRSMTLDRRSQRLPGNARNSLVGIKKSSRMIRKSMKTPKTYSVLALGLDI